MRGIGGNRNDDERGREIVSTESVERERDREFDGRKNCENRER